MNKKNTPASFIAAMSNVDKAEVQPPLKVVPKNDQPTEKPVKRGPSKTPAYRQGLTHFGGYVDAATLEKIALLRIRLGNVDNSALIKQAIEELAKRHDAKRAFGDA